MNRRNRGSKIIGYYDHSDSSYWTGSREGQLFVHYRFEILWGVNPLDNSDGRDRSKMTSTHTWRTLMYVGLTVKDEEEIAQVGALWQAWVYALHLQRCIGVRYSANWRFWENPNEAKPENTHRRDKLRQIDAQWTWENYAAWKLASGNPWPPIKWRAPRYWEEHLHRTYAVIDIEEFLATMLHLPPTTTLVSRKYLRLKEGSDNV